MATPIWLLDVDGVLNAWTGDRREIDGYIGRKINGYYVRWSPSILRRICVLHDEGTVDVQWLTTWGSMANTFISPVLGLPDDLVVAAEIPGGDGGGAGRYANGADGRWWKLARVMAVADADPDRWLVWTDDDIDFDSEARRWATQPESDNVLAISPVGETGLTHSDLDRIEAWLEEAQRDQRS